MTEKKRQILATSALIYANGPVHLGHLVEYIQTDIWTRALRLQGHNCYYICANDAHGTPIMLSAAKRGITPEELIETVGKEQRNDLEAFAIHFDHFYTTHSTENRVLTELIYQRLKARGDIEVRTIEQAFDSKQHMFLPDRYVKGTCPRCNATDQYGDSCESCGATYSPMELIDPISTISNTPPVTKSSEHLFFRVDHHADFLKAWMSQEHLQPQIANKLQEWFDVGLKAWDISRDAPYFGFEIPDAPGKYFYVWLDAPIGYMATFKHFCDLTESCDFSEFWEQDKMTEVYHFVGKDIIYFHALFWPAMLYAADFRTPTAVYGHGFLTIGGQKMSKSRGTFIEASHYLKHLNPEYLRYYFAAKLNAEIEDIDLNLTDFMQRINADLIGKVVNIASRCAGFMSKHFENRLASHCHNNTLFRKLVQAKKIVATLYEDRQFNRAVRTIMELADEVNVYINDQAPWKKMKETGQAKEVQAICTLGLNGFKVLIAYLKPILPLTAERVESFLKIPPLDWDNGTVFLSDHTIDTFTPLLTRITPEQIGALMEHTTE